METTEGDTMTSEGTSPSTSSVTSQETIAVTSPDTTITTTSTTRLTTGVPDLTSSTESTTSTVPSTTTFSDTTKYLTTETTSLEHKVTTTAARTTSSEQWPTTTGSDVITTPPGGDGLSQSAIIGIAVGVSAGVILIIILVVVFCRKRHYRSSQNNYIDGDENPNDYVVYLNHTERQRESASPAAPTSPYAVPFKPESHYAVAEVNSFNNPMYSQGMQLMDDPVIPPSNHVQVRTNGLSKEERELQAASRASMGPILLGEDATYDQMFKTTGTFKG